MRMHVLSCFAIFDPKYTKGTIVHYQRKLGCEGAVSNTLGIIWFFGNKIFLAQL